MFGFFSLSNSCFSHFPVFPLMAIIPFSLSAVTFNQTNQNHPPPHIHLFLSIVIISQHHLPTLLCSDTNILSLPFCPPFHLSSAPCSVFRLSLLLFRVEVEANRGVGGRDPNTTRSACTWHIMTQSRSFLHPTTLKLYKSTYIFFSNFISTLILFVEPLRHGRCIIQCFSFSERIALPLHHRRAENNRVH